MRAVLDALGFREALLPLIDHKPSPLMHVGDRPIIFHVLDFLVKEGVTKVDMAVHHLPDMIEEEVGDGERWGIEITYHLVKDERFPFDTLRVAARRWEESSVILGVADILPTCDPKELVHMATDTPLLLMEAEQHWTGWAGLPTSELAELRSGVDRAEFVQRLLAKSTIRACATTIFTRDFSELLQSNQTCCKDPERYPFPPSAREVEPGVWVSRAAVIHPSARLIPPIFIGEETHINEGCQVGPNVVIENHCVIDKQSIIENALISQKSYVGAHLEVKESIVDRNLLINVAHGTQLEIQDDFILGELLARRKPSYRWTQVLERGIAGLLLLLCSPLLVYQLIKEGPQFRSVVKLPAEGDHRDLDTINWLSFSRLHRTQIGKRPRLRDRLISLIHVWNGEAHFVGLPPRSQDEVEGLSSDWKNLYLNSKIGLITLADLEPGGYMPKDEYYSAEAFYATQYNPWFDIRVAAKALQGRLTHGGKEGFNAGL